MYSTWIALSKPPVTEKRVVSIMDQREYVFRTWDSGEESCSCVVVLFLLCCCVSPIVQQGCYPFAHSMVEKGC